MQLSGRGGAPRAVLFSLLLAALDNVASWDYTTNGESWASLGACGGQLGGIQSPIDLPAEAPVVKGKNVYLKYPKFDKPVQLYHNGYSIAMTMPEAYKAGFGLAPGKSLLAQSGNEAYRLWQVNFHAPSEHTFEGIRMPLEVQLVHRRVTGTEEQKDEVAILVVLFTDAGAKSSDFLASVIGSGLPETPWQEKTINDPASKVPLDFASIVGGSPYFTYEGSLTVPPCSPQVRYVVRKEPALAASDQLQQFVKILKSTCGPNGNYRQMESMSIEGTNLGLDNIFMLNSVEIASSPEVKAEAESSKEVASDALSEHGTTNMAKQCNSIVFKVAERFGNLLAGDTPEIRSIKARYNEAMLNLHAAQSAVGASHRLLKSAQEMYDAAPGYCGCEKQGTWYCNQEPLGPSCMKCPANPTLCASLVTGMPAAGEESCRAYCFSQGSAGAQLAATGASKAELYWNVIAAKRNIVAVANRLQDAEREQKDIQGVAIKMLIEVCKAQKPGEAGVTKVLFYDDEVQLPGGPAASPFTNPLADDTGAGKAVAGGASFSKLAPNLHQADGPPNSIPLPLIKDRPASTGKAKSSQRARGFVEATMKLPLPVKSLGNMADFKRDFAQALASSVNVNPEMIKVLEVNKAPVQDISLAQNSTRDSEVALGEVAALPSDKLTTPTHSGHGFLQVRKHKH
mmetsp:Transcript_147555/g.269073  ORF Transcript_147555/g.269073 Transcript_147555/m.269073 type:complete len:682 (+) Transcript_147555:55-2100(+)